MPLVVLLFLPVITIPLALWLQARDKARRTVVAFYDVNDAPAERFQKLVDAFAAVQGSAMQWHVIASGAIRTTQQFKAHAGATSLLNRVPGRADLAGPPPLATNIAIPSLHARQRSVYFLPDRVLVRDGKNYADLSYAGCAPAAALTRFIEDGIRPTDSVQVSTTWKYVNKSGGPDKRFKDNRQLPIMQYGELTLSSATGLHFLWMTSRPEAVERLARALVAMRG